MTNKIKKISIYNDILIAKIPINKILFVKRNIFRIKQYLHEFSKKKF